MGGLGTQLLSRSETVLKVMANRGYVGPVTVTNVTWQGNTATGDIVLASLDTPDSVTITRARMRGTVVVSNSALGANTEMVITPGPGTTFRTAAPLSTVILGGVPATILRRTADSLYVIATAPYTGGVKVTNIDYGALRLDSLVSGANATIEAGYFPGTVTGGGKLLDTIFVTAAGVTFAAHLRTCPHQRARRPSWSAARPRSSRSSRRPPGWASSRSPGVVGPVWTYSTLNTSAPFLVDNQTTNEANEPGNDDPSTRNGRSPAPSVSATR